eukprot:gene4096-4147_t
MDPHAAQFRIGEAAQQSGVSAANIRYYEKEGLLPPGARGDNSYRLYSSADVHQLRFIRLCRAMDMSLDEVRTLLALDWDSKTDCHAACDTLDAHLVHVRTRLAELQALEADLQALRSRCDGADATCHIIEALHARADAQPVGVNAPPCQGKRHV